MHTNNPSSTTITKILSVSAIIVSLLASGILIGGYQNIGLWSSSSPDGLITLLRDLPQAFLGPLRHADIFHLLGNLMFLWFFGSQLERHIGAYWYLFGYILSISIIHMAFLAFGTRAVGLSGFLMAILSFLAIHLSCLRSKDA